MNTPATKPVPRGLRRVAAVAVLALASTAALSVWAHAPHGGFGGPDGGMMMGGPERGGRMLDRMLERLNASEAQRTQIRQIFDAAAADLRAQRDARRALHERMRELFTAPTVDANAVEALRQQMLAQHDQASRRMSQAMVEASRVLTPEQRAQLAERMKQREQRLRERLERAPQR